MIIARRTANGMVSDADRNGNKFAYNYDAISCALTSIVDTQGRTVNTTIDANGFVTG